MTDLKTHIEALNAETRAWVAAGPDRWATEFHTDMDIWADSGIFTVEDFNQMLDAEHEKEMRKAMYDLDHFYDTYAERNNFDDFYDFYNDDHDFYNDDHDFYNDDHFNDGFYDYYGEADEYELREEMTKFGVSTPDMIPTHFEQMANAAGYLEY